MPRLVFSGLEQARQDDHGAAPAVGGDQVTDERRQADLTDAHRHRHEAEREVAIAIEVEAHHDDARQIGEANAGTCHQKHAP